jgi:RecA/RadA recombinase
MATLSRTFDPSKFQKSITKSIKSISTGFNDPTDWISTGNYALNKRISGDFFKGIPLGKITMFAGESGCLPETALVTVCATKDTVTFFDTVTIKKLKELYHSDYEVEINTPDEFQKITNWFDKGVLPMVKINTDNFETVCATNHMLQREDETWVPASEVLIGDVLLTENGPEKVVLVSDHGELECYDFTIDHPNHRYWGDGFSSHNSGKSFIVSGNIVREAQKQGVFCIVIDSENALDKDWLNAVGVDTSPEKILRISASMINDVAGIIGSFIEDYKVAYADLPREERPKILFVIDSLGMLLSENDVKQFQNHDMKGDMGIKAKQLKAFMTNVTNMLGDLNIGLVVTNHTYKSQDMFSPDDVISSGGGPLFSSSIIVAMRKLKLKKDDDGNKTTEVYGIRAACSVVKTRYAKPFEKIEIEIPYEKGMAPTSGLFDYFKSKGLLVKSGNKLEYTDKNGEVHKYYEKEYNKNENGILDLIMSEWSDDIEHRVQVETEIDENEE